MAYLTVVLFCSVLKFCINVVFGDQFHLGTDEAMKSDVEIRYLTCVQCIYEFGDCSEGECRHARRCFTRFSPSRHAGFTSTSKGCIDEGELGCNHLPFGNVTECFCADEDFCNLDSPVEQSKMKEDSTEPTIQLKKRDSVVKSRWSHAARLHNSLATQHAMILFVGAVRMWR